MTRLSPSGAICLYRNESDSLTSSKDALVTLPLCIALAAGLPSLTIRP